MLYKIVNKKIPENLYQQIPKWEGTRQRRDPTRLRSIKCNTEKRRKSFLPITITWWNNLQKEVRESTTVEQFKKKIKPVVETKCNRFNELTREEEILMSKVRSRKCELRAYSYLYGTSESPLCEICQDQETVDHFLMKCKAFDEQRRKYLRHYIFRNRLTKDELLYGTLKFNDKENNGLIKNVAQYIKETNRIMS